MFYIVAQKCRRIGSDWTLNKKHVRKINGFLMKNLLAHSTVLCAAPLAQKTVVFIKNNTLYLRGFFFGA